MYLQRTQLKSDETRFGTKNKKYLLALAAAVLRAAHKAVGREFNWWRGLNSGLNFATTVKLFFYFFPPLFCIRSMLKLLAHENRQNNTKKANDLLKQRFGSIFYVLVANKNKLQ